MAYRRSLTTKARLFAQQRFTPSISYVHRDHDRKINQHSDEKSKSFLQNRSYSGFSNTSLGFGGGVSFRDPRWSQFLHVPMLARNMSTAIGGEAEKIDFMADVLADNMMMDVVSTQAPAVSEVAVAAADSWMPVAALQYAIDGVHNFTGLNWWGSIVITTLIVRTLTIPIMIYQLKATTKFLTLEPQFEEIKQEMQDKGMSPSAQAEGQEKLKRVFTQHGVTIFTPFRGFLIQGSLFVCFFLAIRNMVDKVPSFKTGGTSWFLDLTTADPFYLLPCLTAFSYWITKEFMNMQEDWEGHPAANTMKRVSTAVAVLIVPLTANFPAALFCYWITHYLFSLGYGLIIKKPTGKKLFDMLFIVPPPSPYSDFDGMKRFAEAYKKYKAGKTNPTATNQSKKPTSEDQKSLNQREIAASVLTQRIKRLEKEVKGRKKNQKRF